MVVILGETRKRTPGQNPKGIDWKSPKAGSGSLKEDPRKVTEVQKVNVQRQERRSEVQNRSEEIV